MQSEKKGLTTAKITKDYLSKNEIPQLFECLMTGLMYNRPTDFITYLEDCLRTIKKHGVNGLRWDMFLEAKHTPLPSIEPKIEPKIESHGHSPRNDYRSQPLPYIGDLELRIDIDASIVLLIAGPGLDKADIGNKLCASFPHYVGIDVGHILRERALTESTNNESRWQSVKDKIDSGELVPANFVIKTLVDELNKHTDKKNFLISGYPRTSEQREDFEKVIGLDRVKFMIIIDCDKEVCEGLLSERQHRQGWRNDDPDAVSLRLDNYEKHTLAVCKYFEDKHKLRQIDGSNHVNAILKDIHPLFVNELNEDIHPHPPSTPREKTLLTPASRAATEIIQLTGVLSDEERTPELAQFKLLLLLGGPSSGKTEVASALCQDYPTWTHLDVNAMLRHSSIGKDMPDFGPADRSDDPAVLENMIINLIDVKEALKSLPDGTEVVILEGYPKNADQLNEFNTEIGRPDCVILLDSEEDVMLERLAHTQGADVNHTINMSRLIHFKNHGLSLCRHYDERSKLRVIGADRNLAEVVQDVERTAIVELKIANDEVVNHDEEVLPMPDERTLDSAEAHAAAVKIQASIRGHLTRKNLSKKALVDEKMETENFITTEDNVIIEPKGDIEENVEETHDDVIIEPKDDIEENVEETHDDVIIESKDDIEENVEETHDDVIIKSKDDIEEKVPETEENEELIIPVTEVPLGKNGVRSNSQLELQSATIVLLIGGPCSGKKTVGSYVVSKLAISFVNVDQIINSVIELESEDTEDLRKFIANEECDETPIYALLRKTLMNSLNVSKIICVTGFPRSVGQFQRFLSDVCPVSSIIYLNADEDVLRSRLSDPDQEADFQTQIEMFKTHSPALLEELNSHGHFHEINAAETLEDVTQKVCDVIETFTSPGNEE